jgi:hypothetical protein
MDKIKDGIRCWAGALEQSEMQPPKNSPTAGPPKGARFGKAFGASVNLNATPLWRGWEHPVALFAHLHVNKEAAPEMYRLPIQNNRLSKKVAKMQH